MGDLCTLDDVRVRLELDTSADNDLLSRFITWASDIIEQQTNRHFDRQINDVYEFPGDIMEVVVPRFPIESVLQVATRRTNADVWTVQDVDYYIEAAAGIVRLVSGPLGTRWDRTQITYTGGCVLPPASPGPGQTALPISITSACVEQVAFWYANRNSLRFPNVTGAGAPTRAPTGLKFLGNLEDVIAAHRRLTIT